MNNDLISRQAAIYAIRKIPVSILPGGVLLGDVLETIRQLPSVQLEPAMIDMEEFSREDWERFKKAWANTPIVAIHDQGEERSEGMNKQETDKLFEINERIINNNNALIEANEKAMKIITTLLELLKAKTERQVMEKSQSIDMPELDQQNAEEMKIGDRIKQRLAEIGMSQRELAQAVNVTEVSMSRYIANNRTPKGPLINSIAKTLDVSCDWLLGMEGAAE